ncbi:MAG: hypothetical protein OXH27_02455 [Gammaproteobacteria bacterium]|nr:hypothetical protein [Gammaproteobacteria bacterium]
MEPDLAALAPSNVHESALLPVQETRTAPLPLAVTVDGEALALIETRLIASQLIVCEVSPPSPEQENVSECLPAAYGPSVAEPLGGNFVPPTMQDPAFVAE